MTTEPRFKVGDVVEANIGSWTGAEHGSMSCRNVVKWGASSKIAKVVSKFYSNAPNAPWCWNIYQFTKNEQVKSASQCSYFEGGASGDFFLLVRI